MFPRTVDVHSFVGIDSEIFPAFRESNFGVEILA